MTDAINGDFIRRLKVYGLTPSDYVAMEEAQGHRCAICNKKRKKFDKRFAIDHDHRTGEIRGLLCARCNYLIGYLHEDIAMFRRAAEYLEIPPTRSVFDTPRRHAHAAPTQEEDTK